MKIKMFMDDGEERIKELIYQSTKLELFIIDDVNYYYYKFGGEYLAAITLHPRFPSIQQYKCEKF